MKHTMLQCKSCRGIFYHQNLSVDVAKWYRECNIKSSKPDVCPDCTKKFGGRR